MAELSLPCFHHADHLRLNRLLQVWWEYHRLPLQQRRVRSGSRPELDEFGRSLLGALCSLGAPSTRLTRCALLFFPDRDPRSGRHAHRKEEGLGFSRRGEDSAPSQGSAPKPRGIDRDTGSSFGVCFYSSLAIRTFFAIVHLPAQIESIREGEQARIPSERDGLELGSRQLARFSFRIDLQALLTDL